MENSAVERAILGFYGRFAVEMKKAVLFRPLLGCISVPAIRLTLGFTYMGFPGFFGDDDRITDAVERGLHQFALVLQFLNGSL